MQTDTRPPETTRREPWLSPDRRQRASAGARRHWLFLTLFGTGVLLRIVTQVAYRPALLFIDSYQYLGNLQFLDPGHIQPIGYEIVIRPVLALGNLAVVVALQHVLGLAMGIAIYAVLVRLGSRRWIAALAALPVLLDAYQLQIEQNILSEVVFEALVLGAIVLLLWKRRPISVPVFVVAGALLGMATTVRVVGLVLVIPAVAFALVAGGPGGWKRLLRVVAIALAFSLPVGAYVAYYRAYTGKLGINRGDVLLVYGRAATIVDCRGFDLPEYERALCPKEPLGQRLGTDAYAHHSPYPDRVVVPAGKTRDTVLREFARRVFLHQPLDFARAVGTDFAKGFAWPRRTFAGDVPLEWWQFQRQYPTFQQDPVSMIRGQGGGGPAVTGPLAAFLRSYQLSVGYTPGPLVALAFLAGLLGAVGVGRARRSGLRAACALPTASGLLLLIGADLFLFSWRYQLPALVLAPLGGALGVTALTAPRPAGDGTRPADKSIARSRTWPTE